MGQKEVKVKQRDGMKHKCVCNGIYLSCKNYVVLHRCVFLLNTMSFEFILYHSIARNFYWVHEILENMLMALAKK